MLFCYALARLSRQISIKTSQERGARTQLAFDVFGNLSSSVGALGDCTELEYDEIGRAVVRHDSVAGDVSYAYDAKSRLVSVRDAAGVILQCACGRGPAGQHGRRARRRHGARVLLAAEGRKQQRPKPPRR